jgi:hypothetical protein
MVEHDGYEKPNHLQVTSDVGRERATKLERNISLLLEKFSHNKY